MDIQDLQEWTNYCRKKIREARSQKCKCLIGTYSILITFKTKDVLEKVKDKELFVKYFVDFAIESRNYILMYELVRLYGFYSDFRLETIFRKDSERIRTITVETFLLSAKYMILRKYPSLLCNSIQLSMCYDCGNGYYLTILVLFKGTSEIDISKERVMGMKLILYNETKPSDEASIVLRLSATSEMTSLPTIKANVARTLFDKHSNLTIISASPNRSIGYSKGKHKLVKEPCYVFFCLHKGYVPYGEEKFPRKIEGFKVDVQEGSSIFGICGSLEMGGPIRRKGSKSSGNIGGFIHVNGKIGLITCAHVVLSLYELENRPCNTADNTYEVEAFVRKTRSYQLCGKIVRAEFPINNEPIECSVDAAIVELDSKFSVAGFRNVAAEQLISAGFDAVNQVIFEGTVIPTEKIRDTSGSVLKFGGKSGLTVGSVLNENMHVRIKKEDTLKLCDSLGNADVLRDVKLYNQMEIEDLTLEQFFEPGDSGSFVFCIQEDTLLCIGMAIGFTTRGTCLVTPIESIMKSLGLSPDDTVFLPAETKLQSKIESEKILAAIAQMQSSLLADIDKRMEEQQKYIDRRLQEL